MPLRVNNRIYNNSLITFQKTRCKHHTYIYQTTERLSADWQEFTCLIVVFLDIFRSKDTKCCMFSNKTFTLCLLIPEELLTRCCIPVYCSAPVCLLSLPAIHNQVKINMFIIAVRFHHLWQATVRTLGETVLKVKQAILTCVMAGLRRQWIYGLGSGSISPLCIL